MYLMYYLDESGTRVYTLSKTDPKGNPTFSAHPARFSPEDRVNKYRISISHRKENVLRKIVLLHPLTVFKAENHHQAEVQPPPDPTETYQVLSSQNGLMN